MSILLFHIFGIAMRQVRQIRKLTVAATPTLNTPENPNRTRQRRFSKRTTMAKELKATNSIFIVYIAFIMVWLPNTVLHMLVFFQPTFHVTKTMWYTFFDVLPVLNTCVNPLVYSFYNRQFRESLLYTWRKMLVRLRITDNYLSRDQQTKRTSNRVSADTIGNPYAIDVKDRITLVRMDAVLDR